MKNKILSYIKFTVPFVFCIALILVFSQEPVKNSQSPKNVGQVLGTSTIRGNNDLISETKPLEKTRDSKLSAINANSFLVYDQATGKTLLEKNSNLELSIASLTKLLTALITYENLDLGSIVTVSLEDINVKDAPKLNLKVGEKVKIEDLFNSMLVGSNNDAALTLANQVVKKTGKPFRETMNEKALELGMQNSSFTNALGFDSQNNFSTAQDLQKLIDHVSKLAAFSNLGKTLVYEFKTEEGRIIKTKNTNKLLLNNPEIEAIKTGYTPNSKGSMAVKLKAFDRNIVIIVIGSTNREKDILSLKNLVLNDFSK